MISQRFLTVFMPPVHLPLLPGRSLLTPAYLNWWKAFNANCLFPPVPEPTSLLTRIGHGSVAKSRREGENAVWGLKPSHAWLGSRHGALLSGMQALLSTAPNPKGSGTTPQERDLHNSLEIGFPANPGRRVGRGLMWWRKIEESSLSFLMSISELLYSVP